MLHPTRQTVIKWAAAVLLTLLVVYPLSYAPVVWLDITRQRARPEYDGFVEPIDGGDVFLYRPADWLIDNTPLREPLFAWARLWGVDDAFRVMNLHRVPPDCILR